LNWFLAGCGLLLVLCAVLIMLPLGRRRGAGVETSGNLDWFTVRGQELADERGDTELLRHDAQLRLLEDEAGAAGVANTPSHGKPLLRHFPVWPLAAVVAVVATLLYHQLGAIDDVNISERLLTLGDEQDPEAMPQLIADLELRLQQRPDNLDYLGLLGRLYMGQKQYGDAGWAYERLSAEAPDDAQALAYAAQAFYLAGNRKLTPKAQRYAEQALSLQPHQRTALGLLGMSAFEQGEFANSINYWQRLLAVEKPDSGSAKMILAMISQARERLGVPDVADAEVVASAASDVASKGFNVHIEKPAQLKVDANDTVFVLARNANASSRMPVAVARLKGSDLPITLRLDDRNSMAGQKLSAVASATVVVQVSPSGQPGAANASLVAQVGPVTPSLDGEPIRLVLAPRQ